MWWVFSPLHADMQRGAQRLGQRAEEVRHQFGGQPADLGARELALEHDIGAAGQVEATCASASSMGSRKP